MKVSLKTINVLIKCKKGDLYFSSMIELKIISKLINVRLCVRTTFFVFFSI